MPPMGQAVLLNLRGELLAEASAILVGNRGVDGLLASLRKLIDRIRQKPPRGAPPAKGLGLALPGRWIRREGVSLSYPRLPEWENIPLKTIIENWTRVPVSLISYASALARAEQARRIDPPPKHLLSVEVAENIAMGIIANGEVLEGAWGNAGELGHLPMETSGPVCYCGNAGCLETLATCSAVVDEIRKSEVARKLFGDVSAVTYEEVVKLAQGGDPFCGKLLGRAAKTLGVGLSAALNLLNPETLVVNGRFFEAGDLVLSPLRASIHEHAVSNRRQSLAIEHSTVRDVAPALGAGFVALQDAVQRL